MRAGRFKRILIVGIVICGGFAALPQIPVAQVAPTQDIRALSDQISALQKTIENLQRRIDALESTIDRSTVFNDAPLRGGNVVVRSQSGGERYEIQLTQTSTDKGRIEVKTWRKGSPVGQSAPDSIDRRDLYGIANNSGRMQITARTSQMFMEFTVVFGLRSSGGGRPASIQIDVQGPVPVPTTLYDLSDSDMNSLRQFIENARFPNA